MYNCTYLYKKARSQIYNLSFHFKKLEEVDKTKPKVSRKKKKGKIKVEINEIIEKYRFPFIYVLLMSVFMLQ